MTLPLVPAVSYHQQRLRHAGQRLLDWLRRWGAYLLAFALVWAVGADSPLALLGAALGALALPMLHAAQQLSASPASWVLPAMTLLGYTLAGLVPVLATRPLWWPQRWAQAEAALPLSAATLRDSDRRLLAWLLAPWLALQVGGLAALLLNNGRLLHQGVLPALLGLGMAGWASAELGLRHMRRVRQRGRAPVRAAPRRTPATAGGAGTAGQARFGEASGPGLARTISTNSSTSTNSTARMPSTNAVVGHANSTVPTLAHGSLLARAPWRRTLLWWPLWRGVARRTGHALLATSIATPALAAAPMAAPGATGWWLAGLALCALGGTAWLRARSHEELAPLRAACKSLPIPPQQLARAARRLVLAPCALALPLAALTLTQVGPRPLVAVAYITWLAGSCLLESRPPPAEAQHHALRWLLCLVVAVSLGSEVLP